MSIPAIRNALIIDNSADAGRGYQNPLQYVSIGIRWVALLRQECIRANG